MNIDCEKTEDREQIKREEKLKQLLSECRKMLDNIHYQYDRTMSNEQLQEFLLNNSENKTSLLIWVLKEIGVVVTTTDGNVLMNSLRSCGILNNNEINFLNGNMCPESQLEKWKLIFECIQVMQDPSTKQYINEERCSSAFKKKHDTKKRSEETKDTTGDVFQNAQRYIDLRMDSEKRMKKRTSADTNQDIDIIKKLQMDLKNIILSNPAKAASPVSSVRV